VEAASSNPPPAVPSSSWKEAQVKRLHICFVVLLVILFLVMIQRSVDLNSPSLHFAPPLLTRSIRMLTVIRCCWRSNCSCCKRRRRKHSSVLWSCRRGPTRDQSQKRQRQVCCVALRAVEVAKFPFTFSFSFIVRWLKQSVDVLSGIGDEIAE
jgi:cytochrome b561